MKTLIIICLYILGAILYAAWCIGDDEELGNKISELEDKWLFEVSSSFLAFRLLIIAVIMLFAMLWPIWIFEGIIKGIGKAL